MPAIENIGPLAAHALLHARDPDGEQRPNPAAGVVDPHSINNTAIFVLFGLIGAAFVVTGIWFFFWARNGGFQFKDNDWDDYKTTVLRRRGPNGTILSNATPSTNLGGGSIYKDVDDNTTTVTDSTGLSGITAGVSNIPAREKRKRRREQKEREKERRKDRSQARRHVGEDGALIDEDAERQAKEQLRNYRHERAARVGGINKESDASTWDGSTNPAESTVASDLLSNRQATPTSTPTKTGGGIRKVYSTADRREEREDARMRAEARRLAERGRAAAAAAASSPIASPSRTERRDFSYQRAESSVAESAMTRSDAGGERVPGSWVPSEVGESELGTKSYRHPIPELRSQSSHSHSQSNSHSHSHSHSHSQGHGHRRSHSRGDSHGHGNREPSRRRSSRRRSRSGYRRGRSDSYTEDGF